MQVHCSNIHFHAHPDGSTTVHSHATCRRKNSKAFDNDNDCGDACLDKDTASDGNDNELDNRNVASDQDDKEEEVMRKEETLNKMMQERTRKASTLTNFSQRVQDERFQKVSSMAWVLFLLVLCMIA